MFRTALCGSICRWIRFMYFKGDPLYPFGFGLSYTTFEYANLKTSSPTLERDGVLTVSVEVTNTGTVAGDDVVQLYVKHPKSRIERPNLELKGFQRVTIDPGERKMVQIPLKASTLAFWNDKQSRLEVESEPLDILIGSSSRDIKLSSAVQVH